MSLEIVTTAKMMRCYYYLLDYNSLISNLTIQQTLRVWLQRRSMKMAYFIAMQITTVWRQNCDKRGVPKFHHKRNRLGAVRFNRRVTSCWYAETPIFPVFTP